MEMNEIGRKIGRDKRKIAEVAGILTIGIILVLILSFGNEFSDQEVPANNSSKEASQNLTDYQRNFVDCPEKYRPLCTEMSKIPTEPVKFDRVEGGKLYLELPKTGRTLEAQIQEGGKDGYFIQFVE